MDDRGSRLVTGGAGAAFAAVAVAVFATGPQAPDETAPAGEVIAFYEEHATQFRVMVSALVVGAVLFLLFAGGLRQLLRSGSGGPGGTDGTGGTGAPGEGDAWSERLAGAMLAGAAVYATGLAVFALSASALVDAADVGEPQAAVALNILDNSLYVLVMIGMSTTMLATGLAALRSGVLPRWLAWASAALGVVAVAGPGGFIAFFAFPFWVLAIAITDLRRTPAPTTSPTSPNSPTSPISPRVEATA